ncbi:MAG: UDP-glucose 4-epimerase GalE [Oscillospiraceae bacterium]|jgi:UDP-glucose 4-epimerase|nr:UDP-glucose 4-epimerase GalE [Oscillospiraceae bacterium]
MFKILITGVAGFIGSHTCVRLLNLGFDIVGIDNFHNSSHEVINSILKITNRKIVFYEADIRNSKKLCEIFKKEKPEAVIHFAGLKSVAESVEKPLEYYDNNVSGTICLCRVMEKFGIKKMIFSSSATVYENSNPPFDEESQVSAPKNPYGKTKFTIEQILFDLKDWDIALLRYFNPIGAHESGDLKESPLGIPNNLMPHIINTALGKMPFLTIFGNDYPTFDGTCVRDYIHVEDLSEGHSKALDFILNKKGIEVFNLGTGIGTSVLELIKIFEKTNKIKLKYKIGPRRLGDVAVCYALTEKSQNKLNWKPRFDIEKMCRDAWDAAL